MSTKDRASFIEFLDVLGVRWVQPDPYLLPDGSDYQPDFWLPDLECFVEVRDHQPTHEEQSHRAALTAKNTRLGLVFCGMPDARANEGYGFARGKFVGFSAFVECLSCGEVGIVTIHHDLPDHYFFRLRCQCRRREGQANFTTDSYCLQRAYKAAQAKGNAHA